jgi:hypothetical protein
MQKCKGCGKDSKTPYCEDHKGYPLCNSEGPLSPRSREILLNKEVPYDKVIPGAECPKKEYK